MFANVSGFKQLKNNNMGRELKRVPLDFQWEINKLWCGYINPHKAHECKECICFWKQYSNKRRMV